MPIDISKIGLPDNGRWLVKAVQTIGNHNKHSRGVCSGLTYALRDFAFKEPFETTLLRLKLIYSFQLRKTLPNIIEQMSSLATTRESLPLETFADGQHMPEIKRLHEALSKTLGEIPDAIFLTALRKIPEFLQKIDDYQNTPWPLVSTKNLDNAGIAQTGSLTGIYGQQDLIDCFTLFSEVYSPKLKKQPSVVASVALNTDHAILFLFFPKLNQWRFFNTNCLNGKSIAPCNEETFASQLLQGFSTTGVTTFATEIYTPKVSEYADRESFLQWKNQMQAIHQPSPIKALAVDSNNTSWLCIAAKYNDFQTVEELLQQPDSGINEADYSEGWTPLHFVAQDGNAKIMWKLLENGADINQTNKENCTPLHIAAVNNQPEIVEELLIASETLKLGANINATDENGFTALHYAAAYGFTKIASELLDALVDVNKTDKNGMTPLHHGAKNGHNEIISLLLTQDCNINAQNNDGDTPLHIAAANGNSAIVEKLLLQKNTRINLRNKAGHTPRDLARLHGHSAVRKQLNEKVWELTPKKNPPHLRHPSRDLVHLPRYFGIRKEPNENVESPQGNRNRFFSKKPDTKKAVPLSDRNLNKAPF